MNSHGDEDATSETSVSEKVKKLQGVGSSPGIAKELSGQIEPSKTIHV